MRYTDPTGYLSYEDIGGDPSIWGWLVGSGDTLTSISNETGFSINQILGVNPQITNPDMIYAGGIINIPQEVRIRAFEWSMQQVGSTAYARSAKLDNIFGEGDFKCNAFPRDAYQLGAGIRDYPLRNTLGTFLKGQNNAPISAAQLGDPNSYGPFSITTNPLPGDIVSSGVHAGIVGLGGNYISASSITDTVVIAIIKNSLGNSVTYKRYK